MENQKLNKEILQIWKDKFEEIKKISGDKFNWPLLIPNFIDSPILFLGINPSGDSKEKFRIDKKEDLDNEKKINSFIEEEELNIRKGGYRKYFKEFEKISEKVLGKKQKFNHLDLYFYRGRKSKDFMNLIKKNTSIFENQLNLSINAIKNSINPKVIFVANKNASDIIIKKLEIKKEVFDKEGFYIIEMGKRKIPIFFSGMISSARSIDNYTLERLVWHIKKAIKWYDENNQNGEKN